MNNRVFVLFLTGFFLTGFLFLYVRAIRNNSKLPPKETEAILAPPIQDENLSEGSPEGVQDISESEADEATILSNIDTVIQSTAFCSALNDDGSPKERTDLFYTDSRQIWLTIQYQDAKTLTVFKTVWIYHNPEKPFEFNYAHAAEGSGWLPYYLGAPEKGWPTGNYSVLIFEDDKYVLTKRFSVSERESN